MLIGYDYFNETRSFGKDLISWLTLRTTSVAVNERVTNAIDGMFANSPYETTTDSEKAFSKAFAAQLGNIALIVELVVGAAFVTILMIVGNTMVMTVRERTREIGVMKTLGFSGGRILRMVLGESILLALLGGLPGLGVAFLLITKVRDGLMSFVPTLSLYPRHRGGGGRADDRVRPPHRHRFRRSTRCASISLPRSAGADPMRSILLQMLAVTAINLKSLPQRLWMSLATVIGSRSRRRRCC